MRAKSTYLTVAELKNSLALSSFCCVLPAAAPEFETPPGNAITSWIFTGVACAAVNILISTFTPRVNSLQKRLLLCFYAVFPLHNGGGERAQSVLF